MTNELARETKDKISETQRSKAQSERRILERAIDKAFAEHKSIDEFVIDLFKEATEKHQGWAYQEILNRKFGKVKEIVDINMNIPRPDQEETEQLEERFKNKGNIIDITPSQTAQDERSGVLSDKAVQIPIEQAEQANGKE